ncbi:MAG: DUF47 family protein [Candidatus Micrarchaeales archaeon]
MKLFDILFLGGEKKILLENIKMLEISRNANEKLALFIKKRGNELAGIKALEKEGDKRAFEIAFNISSGSIAPNIIDKMLALVEFEDDIIDSIYHLAREYGRYIIPEKEVNNRIKKHLLADNAIIKETIETLFELENTSNIDKIRELAKKIEKLEENEDTSKDSMLTYLYTINISNKSFHNANLLVRRSDDIMDACEKVSRSFTLILLSLIS